ncbi:MAG: STAS-like domain-containing protein [Bacteroidales bacterium]
MTKIKVSEDFTMTPGARYRTDGPHSGEEFFEEILKPRFSEALEKGETLTIDLDGTNGYASSFLNESFRLLKEEFGDDICWNNIELISEEYPKYIDKIKLAIYEK